MLHRGDRRTLTTKKVRETEAEAVAFVVCQAVGLETGTAAADYIQLWHGDANLLRESLQAVQQTACRDPRGIAPEPSAADECVKEMSARQFDPITSPKESLAPRHVTPALPLII